jgi:hypothetical protein
MPGALKLLLVLPARLGDAFERLSGRIVGALLAEVAKADDAAQPFLIVDHR